MKLNAALFKELSDLLDKELKKTKKIKLGRNGRHALVNPKPFLDAGNLFLTKANSRLVEPDHVQYHSSFSVYGYCFACTGLYLT